MNVQLYNRAVETLRGLVTKDRVKHESFPAFSSFRKLWSVSFTNLPGYFCRRQ